MKIKKDSNGLYVRCAGWIARPNYHTEFEEGEDVRVSRPKNKNKGNDILVRKAANRVQSTWERWPVSIPYWWHQTEGKDDVAKAMREGNVAANPAAYTELKEAFDRGEQHG